MQGAVLDGRYELLDRIGAGGMGQVWRAEDTRLGRRVAVKLLSVPQGTGGETRERLLAMFVREARAAAALDSSYIVPVFDHGMHEDVPYLVMPLIAGSTVGDLLAASGPLPLRQVATIGAQVCRALATAHAAGIVHRDIKPANVMVTGEDTVKILDFGVAKFVDATTAPGYLTSSGDAPVGTLHYMAPERFTGQGDDGGTDVYALGCMVHQMLTGAPPFDSGSAVALMHAHVYETPGPPSARRPGLAPAWDNLVRGMLAKDIDQRPDARHAQAALEALATDAQREPGPAAPATPGVTDKPPAPPAPAHAPPTPKSPTPKAADNHSDTNTTNSNTDTGAFLLAPPLPGNGPAPTPAPTAAPAPTPTPAGYGPPPPQPANAAVPTAPSAGTAPPPLPPAPPSTPGAAALSASTPVTHTPVTATPGPATLGGPTLPPGPGTRPRGAARNRRRWAALGVTAALVAGVGTVAVVQPFDGLSLFSGDGGSDDNSQGDKGDKGDKGANPDDDGKGTPGEVAKAARTETLSVGTAEDSRGPAPAVRAAEPGGTIGVLEPGDLATLDPAAVIDNTERAVMGLTHRSLTGLKTAPDGTVKVVGDLAEDAGKSSDGGRTWTFRLKPGLKYADGTPIRSADIRHGIERTLGPDGTGSSTLRLFLLGASNTGGFGSTEVSAETVMRTPDDRTIVFRLAQPHHDFNAVLTDFSTAPVPVSFTQKPGGAKNPPSSGPYRTESITPGQKAVLVRNSRWDAKTDPLRTAYPDRYEISLMQPAPQIEYRIRAATGTGTDPLMTFTGMLSKSSASNTGADKNGRLAAEASYVKYYMVNTQKVKDERVRQALLTALPADDVMRATGDTGKRHHSLIPPGLRGGQPSDQADPDGPGSGDTEAARQLLESAGEDGYRITLPRMRTPDSTATTEVVSAALRKAGFEVTVEDVEAGEYYRRAAAGDFHFFQVGYLPDAPVASALLPVLFDGRLTAPNTANYARLKDPAVDRSIDEAYATEDLAEAGDRWAEVNDRVLAASAAVPMYVPRPVYPVSPTVGGVQAGPNGLSPLNVYRAR
ncbi:protein kinase [Streptomyces sp. NA04227]|uniref:ABC transporter substrate-binding protein n=1 Tax=Streptomyces sp. NA04227 TaxID=2742136 RepID=UPI001599E83B|nr:ABC transporter substrate-binding protein [Streptomyces sp. NA04227]QKW07665.1 protein kinase [Streptomyces sp. NA04227]